MKIYTDYDHQAASEVNTVGQAIDYIKANCTKDVLKFGSNTIVYWLEIDKLNAIEITYHHPTNTLNLLFTGQYGAICSNHRFIHQMQ